MELKLTTARALKFEKNTGKGIIEFLKEVSDTGTISLTETVELFAALGDNYTVEVFDAWDIPYAEKLEKMFAAVTEYVQGKK